MATFILSEKGRRKLCDKENYIYEKHTDSRSKTKIYWRCEQFYKGCRARIHTTFNCSEPEVILSTGSHNHSSSNARVNTRKVVSLIKSQVMRTGTVSTREVVADPEQDLGEEAQSQIETIPGLARNVHNWRQHTLRSPALPTNRSGFEVSDYFKCFKNGYLVLVF